MGKREAASQSSASSLLRDAISSYEKRTGKKVAQSAPNKESAPKFVESNFLRPIEAAKPPEGEGPRMKVLLIDEGLGNRRNMNYYGPEAIESAVKAFEGKPSFVNHPSQSEDEDLPERDLGKQFGYFKNLHVETIEGKKACVGELHFDLSEVGRRMYAKTLTALHYQKEFPSSEMQYMGWSVLGGGIGDERKMTIDGEELEVNYVTEFTEGESCDAVTKAGRGGRVIAVVENADGNSKEDGMKKLKATLAKVQESAKKATGEAKKALESAVKDFEVTIKVMEEDALAGEGEGEAGDPFHVMCKKKEGEDEVAHKARLHDMAKHLAGHLQPHEEGEGEGEDESISATPMNKQDDDTTEAKREAVESYASKAGLPEGAYSASKLGRLAKMKFSEAKALIDDDAKLAEASRKELAKSLDFGPVARLGSREAHGNEDRTDVFAESMKEAR